MTDFSFGLIFSRLREAVDGDAPALIHGDRITTWAEFDRRTDALAAAFIAAGARPGDTVAHLMRNGPAYLETTVAAFKARLVHVNVNYRYTGPELLYILDNSDAAVLVHDAEFADVLDTLDLPKLKLRLEVGSSFEVAATGDVALPAQDHRGDDMLFIYTGGTTGMPKGVMWDQSAIWALSGGGGSVAHGIAPTPTIDDLLANVRAGIGVIRSLIMPPLMHGTGYLTAIYTLARGGCVVTLTQPGFSAIEALEACAKHRPDYAAIVGDAFARPLLRALDAGGGTIASIGVMISSGTMWSPEVKAGLIAHHPGLVTVDAFSSSESIGMGAAVRAHGNADEATRFMIDEDTQVLDDALQPVVPGSGVLGRVARGGLLPRGYYKDEVKSAATFVQVGGKRFSIPGDWATVEADGSITLFGRGSHCINTGGEKVFPEEVEEVLKTHALVDDALVFGTADAKWGQAVTAVVEAAGADPAELTAHVRAHLAPYKTPKRIVIVEQVPRAPNGKADYERAKAMAA